MGLATLALCVCCCGDLGRCLNRRVSGKVTKKTTSQDMAETHPRYTWIHTASCHMRPPGFTSEPPSEPPPGAATPAVGPAQSSASSSAGCTYHDLLHRVAGRRSLLIYERPHRGLLESGHEGDQACDHLGVGTTMLPSCWSDRVPTKPSLSQSDQDLVRPGQGLGAPCSSQGHMLS